MKKQIFFSLLLIAFFNISNSQVIISQYYEGSGNNKWIELTNVGETIDLALNPISLHMVAGSSAKNVETTNPILITTFNSGNWDTGVSKLIKHGSAVLPDYATAEVSTNALSFNGAYDVIFISTSNSTAAPEAWNNRIDIVGEVVSSMTTNDDIANISLVRNSDIVTNSNIYNSSDWTQYTNDAVNVAGATSTEYLGVHIFGTNPLIVVSPAILSGFTYNVGNGPSDEQTFLVSASNVTANMLVTPPTNYEISETSNTNYSSSAIELTKSGTEISPTTIYVRLKAGLTENTYNDENIQLTTTGADLKTVTCSGEVLNPLIPNNLPYSIDFSSGDINQDFWSNQAVSDPNYKWTIESLSGNNVVRMGNYNSGTYENVSAWYVSPPFNTQTEVNLMLNFMYGVYDYEKGKLSVMASKNYDGTSNPESQGTWIDFTPTFTSGNYNTLYDAPNVNLSSLLPASVVYVAFKFADLSDTNEGNTWRIDNITMSNAVSIENEKNNDFIVFPNPANDMIFIELPNNINSQISIADITGQVLYSSNINSQKSKIDLSKFAKGIYFIEVKTLGKSLVKKIILE